MKYLIWFILIAVSLHFINKFLSRFKAPSVGSVCMVTGAVKSLKTTFSFCLAKSEYRRVRFNWYVRCFFCKLFRKPLPEEPLLYSNIPLGIPYVPVTTDMIERKARCRFGSVVYIDEASLLADSMLIKNMDRNERINLYFKLFGHMSHGGKCILNTQCIGDTHFGIKRSLGNYFYVHHAVKWIPFFVICYVRECLYSDDNTSLVNVVTRDAELDLRRVIIRKSVWKMFDCYAFSSLTDDLPVEDRIVIPVKGESLKIKKIVSFRDFYSIDDRFLDKNNEVNNDS